MERYPEHERYPHGGLADAPGGGPGGAPGGQVIDTIGGVELLEDRTRRLQGTSHGRRLGQSVPTAAIGAVLVATLAFGAAGVPGSPKPPSDDTIKAAQVDGDQEHASPSPKPDPMPEPKSGPAETGKDDSQPKDEEPKHEEPTPDHEKPAPTEPTTIEIAVAAAEGKVVIEWSACVTDGFYAWKVVRSSDATITWPKGVNDTTVAASEDVARRRALDSTAPAGTKVFYRVFGIALTDGSKVAACASQTKGVLTAEAKPDPTTRPSPKPTPKPAEAGTLEIGVKVVEGHPWIEWSTCKATSWDGYKVVRSKDSTVSFPEGSGDTVIAFVGADGKNRAYDKHVPGGTTLWYRVFCVDKTDAGYVVRAASAAKTVTTPASEPAPEPVTLGFELDLTDKGVALHWQACTSESFVYYKVVRSAKSNPSYLPGTDGSTVIAVIDNPSTTKWLDAPDAGTWYYRIQAIGYHDGAKVLLGQTKVLSVTVE